MYIRKERLCNGNACQGVCDEAGDDCDEAVAEEDGAAEGGGQPGALVAALAGGGKAERAWGDAASWLSVSDLR